MSSKLPPSRPSPRVETAAPTKQQWFALGTLAAGLGMIVLDGTIVAVALPDIIRDLEMSLTDAEWVNSLYAVIVAALLLGTGSLADKLGRKNIFITGLILFVIGSVLAGVTSTPQLLLASRAVQAVGGAAIMPATLSTVNALFRGKYRAMAFGIWGAVISGAAAIGPLAGGALTEWASWRWIFFVNIPIGAVLFVAAILYVPETRGTTQKGFDYAGLLLSGVALGSLVFAIIEGPNLGWWAPKEELHLFNLTWTAAQPTSIVPWAFGVALVGLVLFLFWERGRAAAGRPVVLDVQLFSLPTFSWGNVTASMVAIGEFSLLFVLPLFLINVLALNVMDAGLILAAMALGAFSSGALARHIAARLGSPGTVILGLALEIVGVAVLTALIDPNLSGWALAMPLIVYGLGLGLASAQLTGTILQDVPVGQSGQGSATQSMVRQIGSALGTAFAGTALSVALSTTLPNSLSTIGMAGSEVAQLSDATRISAGSNLMQLRASGESGVQQVADALSAGFTQAVRIAMLTSGIFLLIGLLGSIVVWTVAKRSAKPEA